MAATRPQLLEQHAVRDAERAGRSAVIMPIGVLAGLPGEELDVAGFRAMQGQIPTLPRDLDDELLPEQAVRRHRSREDSELARRKPVVTVQVRVDELRDRATSFLVDDGRGGSGLALRRERRSPGHLNCQFRTSRGENCTRTSEYPLDNARATEARHQTSGVKPLDYGLGPQHHGYPGSWRGRPRRTPASQPDAGGCSTRRPNCQLFVVFQRKS